MPYSDPDKQRAAKAAWARQARAGGSTSRSQGDRGTSGGTAGSCRAAVTPLPYRVKTAEEILALLAESIGEVRAEREIGTLERARTIGYLCGIALRAVETFNVEARLEAVESILTDQKKAVAERECERSARSR